MDIYFLIGIVISVILAYWGIWHSNKNRTVTQLSIVDQIWMNLLSTFEDNFKTLKIENYQLPINTNLYYYKGTIINTGNTDIDKLKVYKPFKISLPQNFKIVEFKVQKKYVNEIGLSKQKLENDIIFEWELLKPLESFSFELILECSKAHNKLEFQKEIKLSHRISDLKKINRLDGDDLKDNINKNIFYNNSFLYVGLLFMLSFFLFAAYSGIKSFFSPELHTETQLISKKTSEPVTLTYFNSDSVKLFYGKIVDTIPIKLIDGNITSTYKVNVGGNHYFSAILGTLLSIFLLFLLIFILKEHIQEYKKIKIIRSLKD